MHYQKSSFDDLLRSVLSDIIESGESVSASRGSTRELYGVLLELQDPRSRLSVTESRGKIFSCLGELFWYLSGTASLDYIKYYLPQYSKDSEDGATIHGAYGPRLFDARGVNQLRNIISLLSSPDRRRSRRAVIQIFDASDLATPGSKIRREVPCTSTLQFVMPDDQLTLIVNMRSNDALYGLPHDVFAFTMLQEIVARTLGVEVGRYIHFVGSMHLYEDKVEEAEEYLREGFQDLNLTMPPMPTGDPWPAIEVLKSAEKLARSGRLPDEVSTLDPYWQDIARMFLVFAASKRGNEFQLRDLSKKMHSEIYSQYVEAKIEAASGISGHQRMFDWNVEG